MKVTQQFYRVRIYVSFNMFFKIEFKHTVHTPAVLCSPIVTYSVLRSAIEKLKLREVIPECPWQVRTGLHFYCGTIEGDCV